MDRICGRCGQRNQGIAAYCLNCGSKLAEQNVCLGCSEVLFQFQSYCHICGTKIGGHYSSGSGQPNDINRKKAVENGTKIVMISAATALCVCIFILIIALTFNVFGTPASGDRNSSSFIPSTTETPTESSTSSSTTAKETTSPSTTETPTSTAPATSATKATTLPVSKRIYAEEFVSRHNNYMGAKGYLDLLGYPSALGENYIQYDIPSQSSYNLVTDTSRKITRISVTFFDSLYSLSDISKNMIYASLSAADNTLSDADINNVIANLKILSGEAFSGSTFSYVKNGVNYAANTDASGLHLKIQYP